jgi:hypothetical protein
VWHHFQAGVKHQTTPSFAGSLMPGSDSTNEKQVNLKSSIGHSKTWQSRRRKSKKVIAANPERMKDLVGMKPVQRGTGSRFGQRCKHMARHIIVPGLQKTTTEARSWAIVRRPKDQSQREMGTLEPSRDSPLLRGSCSLALAEAPTLSDGQSGMLIPGGSLKLKAERVMAVSSWSSYRLIQWLTARGVGQFY